MTKNAHSTLAVTVGRGDGNGLTAPSGTETQFQFTEYKKNPLSYPNLRLKQCFEEGQFPVRVAFLSLLSGVEFPAALNSTIFS